MLVRRTRLDPARPTGASPGARPPRPRSNRESGNNEPGVRAYTVRPAPQRPRCLRAEPAPSGLLTMQDPHHNLPAFPRAPHMYRRQIGRGRGDTCRPPAPLPAGGSSNARGDHVHDRQPGATSPPGSCGIAVDNTNDAIENLTRHRASELGAAGIRVACLRTAANPDSRTI